MREPFRLLTLSVSAGAGHVRAAEAVCKTAEARFQSVQAAHLDVLQLVPEGFRKLYGTGYIKLVEKAPLFWAYMYQHTDEVGSTSLLSRFRRAIERLNTRKLEAEIEAFEPDAILCTHFLPAELLSRRIARGKPTPPVWVLVTDFDVHGLWQHPHMAGYFVASDEVAARLSARGIARDKIHVTGISIMPVFREAPPREIAAAELGLDPQKFTVLAMSGGAGMGGIDALVGEMAEKLNDVQIIALAGRNEALRAKLQEIADRYVGRVLPLGFTPTIQRVMAAADIAVTKPGGLTSSECLAMELPMIVVSPIPGQEERNSDTLLENGCALKAVDTASLLFKINALQKSPERRVAMQAAQRKLARPAAADSIIKIITAGGTS